MQNTAQLFFSVILHRVKTGNGDIINFRFGGSSPTFCNSASVIGKANNPLLRCKNYSVFWECFFLFTLTAIENHNMPASKVVHCRAVADGCKETDLVTAMKQFGKIKWVPVALCDLFVVCSGCPASWMWRPGVTAVSLGSWENVYCRRYLCSCAPVKAFFFRGYVPTENPRVGWP